MTLDSVLRGHKEPLRSVMHKRSFSCGVRNSEPQQKLSYLAAHYTVLAIPFLTSQVSRPRHICNAYYVPMQHLLFSVKMCKPEQDVLRYTCCSSFLDKNIKVDRLAVQVA